MARYHFDKLFSPAEANELIPRLEMLVRDLQASTNELRSQISKLSSADKPFGNFGLADLIEHRPEIRPAAAKVAELVGQIESFGCFLKDVDLGLVDFPSDVVGEEVVFLCWQFGESRVAAWHPVEGGFAQRKPLPGAYKTYLN